VCASTLAEVASKPDLATRYKADAERVKSAWRERLWNPEKQLFAAGREVDGSFTEDPATHANILALLFDLCDDQQRPLVLESVYRTLLRNPALCAEGGKRNGIVQLYFINYALAAFYKWDRPDAAEAVFRAHWGLLKDWGALTTWEALKPSSGSHCHVWTSSPLIHMARDILGVRQKNPPRDDVYVIEPSAETLDWAAGVYPLLDGGKISVRWRVEAGLLHIEVLAPDSIRVEIAPRGRLGKLPRREYREPGSFLASTINYSMD
jgi:hypothetical protein